MSLVDRFIQWAKKRVPERDIVTHGGGKLLFRRWEFLRWDEWSDYQWDQYREKYPVRPCGLPWWMPFNVFLHRWEPEPGALEEFHDHPRWSVTIVLKGRITEVSPWGQRLLKPGSIVIRSRKAIHRFEIPLGAGEEIWTLFVVGRRKARQNTYAVTPQ